MIDQNEKDENSKVISIEIESNVNKERILISRNSNSNDNNIDMVNSSKKINNKKNNDKFDMKQVLTLNNIEQRNSSAKKTITSVDKSDSNRINSLEKYPPKEDNKQLSEYRNLMIKSSDRQEYDEISNIMKQNNDCASINEENDKHLTSEFKINQIKMSLNDFVRRTAFVSPIMCLLCDKYLQINSMYKSANCYHYFCRKCGKLYYEEKIEQGDNELKCPMYSCQAIVSLDLIELLVSNQHFSGLKGGRNESNHLSLLNKEVNDNDTLQKIFHRKIDTMKPYSNKHVLDINTNEAFYMFSQTKDQFCPNCHENSLFSKSGNHFIKCLNCFHTICKYCFTRYYDSHMDISTADHCKVYYRKKEKYYLDNNKCKFYCIQLLLVMASFLIIFAAAFHYFKDWLMTIFCIKCCKSRPIVVVLIYFLSIVLFICSIPFILLSFPYFPIIIEALG